MRSLRRQRVVPPSLQQELSQTACILVDAGQNVDDDDHLTTVLLTYAHSVTTSPAENLCDGAPIYTTEATARVLGPVLSEAQQYAACDFGDADAVLNALRGLPDSPR